MASWAEGLSDDASELIAPGAGEAVRWTAGRGWVGPPATTLLSGIWAVRWASRARPPAPVGVPPRPVEAPPDPIQAPPAPVDRAPPQVGSQGRGTPERPRQGDPRLL